MLIFLALVIRNEGEGKHSTRLLSLLERVNFRVYMARNVTARTDTGQGDLYCIRCRLLSQQTPQQYSGGRTKTSSLSPEDDQQALEYRLVQFALWYAPDSVLEDSFRKRFK